MSSSLAIGAVTAVLRRLIDRSVTDHGLATTLGAAPEVTCLPPGDLDADAAAVDRINLFLFQATENQGWRNLDFPSRNGNGDRQSNPKLALDLHYLLTAYGAADLHADVLLGHAMFVLHETPVLTRQTIRDILASLPGTPLHDALEEARLADQVEQIKIVPRVLSVEEVSKIWTAIQSKYHPTAAYQVSVVLIEAQQPAISALPVLTRGRPIVGTDRDEGVFVQPDLLPPVPYLEAIELPAPPAIRIGETLTLRGRRLDGANQRARFRLLRGTAQTLELPAAAVGSTTWTVAMPTDPPPLGTPPASPEHPDNWRAGVYEVSGALDHKGKPSVTNRLPVALAPRLLTAVATIAGGAVTQVTVTCSPKVHPGQEVALIVGEVELRLGDALAGPSDTLVFPAPDPPRIVPIPPQPARLRVDGIESIVVDRTVKPPRFDPTQVVT